VHGSHTHTHTHTDVCASGLTFRQADGALVVQVVLELGRSEAHLVGAEAHRGFVSGGRGREHGGPAFRRRDVDAHQAVLPPPVADPRLPVGRDDKR